MIIGVDEVGRGCLAGDLLVCAVCFDGEFVLKEVLDKGCQLADSKAFSSKVKRRKAYDQIITTPGVKFAFARKSPDEISRIGIHFAVLNAMSKSANDLMRKIGERRKVLFDGRFIPEDFTEGYGEFVVKGDTKIPEISAASILAKVTRDEEMSILGSKYPEYGFERHAGYGTKDHISAIQRFGLLKEHRSWAYKFTEHQPDS